MVGMRGRRAVETAARDAKPAFAGWGILVREGGLCNMIDDFNRAVFDGT
jgi:hypothetical protein